MLCGERMNEQRSGLRPPPLERSLSRIPNHLNIRCNHKHCFKHDCIRTCSPTRNLNHNPTQIVLLLLLVLQIMLHFPNVLMFVFVTIFIIMSRVMRKQLLPLRR